MTHFGIMCPPATGHFNPIIPLAFELQKRGHRLTVLGRLDVQDRVLASGLDFRAIGEEEFPLGSTASTDARMGELSGLKALRYNLLQVAHDTFVRLQKAPSVIRSAGIDALLIDQYTPGGESIADFLGTPFISVCNGLPLNREVGVPPVFTHWLYKSSRWSHLRNWAGYTLADSLASPIRKVIEEYRSQWKLPLYPHLSDAYSRLAQLSQQPAEFEFPRISLPPCFHFTGPYHSQESRQPVLFPFEKLTKQKLVYASLGTLQNRLVNVFIEIAEACADLDVQLVLSLGGALNPEELPQMPGAPLVVKYAPQLELLKKASLTITHAGLNTVLESLTDGVPMVAIPIANDQPGTAARIAWTGVGEVVPLAQLNTLKLRTAIHQVLTTESYKANSLRLQKAIRNAGGVKQAADIIEQAVATGKPVLS